MKKLLLLFCICLWPAVSQAITVADSGTKTADGTEQTLYTTTTSNVYTLSVDLSNMAASDTTVICAYKKVLTGSTHTKIGCWTFNNNVTYDIFYVPPIFAPFGAQFTLQQTAGTNRNYDWSVETP